MRRALSSFGLSLALASTLGCSRNEEQPAAPAPKEAASTLSGGDTAALDAAAAEANDASSDVAPPAPRTLAGKKVLHVGDSMVGGHFGLTRALEAKLTEHGAKIIRHTTVSESLASFDKTPTLKDLLRTHDPDIVVITLGANDANVPHPEVHARSIENIVRRVGTRECWWIGPPTIKNASTGGGPSSEMSVVSVIRDHAGTCRFFDSSKLELERASDGIHPNDRGAAKWAEAFWRVFFEAEPR